MKINCSNTSLFHSSKTKKSQSATVAFHKWKATVHSSAPLHRIKKYFSPLLFKAFFFPFSHFAWCFSLSSFSALPSLCLRSTLPSFCSPFSRNIIEHRQERELRNKTLPSPPFSAVATASGLGFAPIFASWVSTCGECFYCLHDALNPTANAPDLVANALDLAGQVPSPLEQMNLLDSVHHNLIQDFNPVKKEGYINNAIYDCIRCLLKDYRWARIPIPFWVSLYPDVDLDVGFAVCSLVEWWLLLGFGWWSGLPE